ncbi:perlucin-like [Diabrotica virgifera virgifera]|uniref:Perlucin-like n=1 Tax=Diabrotica virgifera virgifera TaxID=50390 RepID=A0A6P7FPT4_DIAVI|nr:perlucin-like [Diabrotica virgifera virgifera]
MIRLISLILYFSYLCKTGESCDGDNPKLRYFLGAKKVNWAAAIKLCQTVGMSLVSIQNKEKSDQITQFLESTGVNYDSYDTAIWTSGNRLQDKVNWFWLAREPVRFTNWDTRYNEPNNYGGNEECISILKDGAITTWNDIACNREFYPLCEKSMCCSLLN